MQDNEYITLAEAAKLAPGRPSSNCIWRWCRRGVRSRSGQTVCLDHIRVGGRIFTTRALLGRFFAAVAEADREYFDKPQIKPAAPTSKNSSRNRSSADRAEIELNKAGI